MASNGSKIPARDLEKLMRIIEAQHRSIENSWRIFFGDDAALLLLGACTRESPRLPHVCR